MKIKLIKFNENLIMPIRAHYNDAGIDCFAQEDFSLSGMTGAWNNEENGNIYCDIGSLMSKNPIKDITEEGKIKYSYSNPHVAMIPLGFGLEVPNGYMATIRPRSSMNAKGIITQIGTIDSGYRGEIKAVFINLNANSVSFKRGDKICQIVVEPVVLAEPVLELGDERGTGGFGSTGK